MLVTHHVRRTIFKHAHVASGHCRVCPRALRFDGFAWTQKVRCASPSVSNRFRSPSFKRFTTDFDNCDELSMTNIGIRSSSVVQHLARLAGSFRLQPALRSRTTSGSTSNKLQLAACLPGQKTSATSDVSQQSSHSRTNSTCTDWTGWLFARSCKLGNPAFSAVLHVARSACTTPLLAERCSSVDASAV